MLASPNLVRTGPFRTLNTSYIVNTTANVRADTARMWLELGTLRWAMALSTESSQSSHTWMV